jgi:hypothetical protein
MKTYKLISPSIGHISNFQAKNDVEAAKYVKEHNEYHRHYGNNARTFKAA